VALRPSTLMFDTRDPLRVATFWAAALGFELDPDSDQTGGYIADPSARTPGAFFQPVPEPKVVKNRVHLDLRPDGTMTEEVERLRGLGATEIRYVDEGYGWTVMADPEGAEFCVLRGVGEDHKRDVVPVDSLVIDATHPFPVADFWIRMLGYREHARADYGIEIVGEREGDPMLSFVTVPEPKTVKNRIHLDVRPTDSMKAGVERVLELGGSVRGFIETDDSFWTQMRDVEGNEFCVLRGPDDGWSADQVGM
jgi:predicted enzyme related to lactoylglutathione lyase